MEPTANCPNCGATRIPESPECMTCGIVYARYKGPRQEPPTSEPITTTAPAPARPAHSEPLAEQEVAEGVWRRGKTLIVKRLATLPNRCVSCNEPAETRLHRKLYWHSSWVYIFVLVNLFVYILIAMVVRKKAELDIPQCARHAKIRRYGFLGAWAFMGVGTLVAYLSAYALEDGPVTATPIVIFLGSALVALIVGFSIGRPVVPTRIDDEVLWLGKCSKNFLSSLPEAPKNI